MESDFLNQMPQLLFILLFIFESKQHPGSILNTVKHFFLPFFSVSLFMDSLSLQTVVDTWQLFSLY